MISKIKSMIELSLNKTKTLKLSKIKLNSSGINIERREIKVIVSLTSYPGRINVVHKTIKTLLNQSYKPDKVILWLADTQFPDRIIPGNLKELIPFGLSIKWCDDIKSYKKLVPTLEMFPNDIIVTADDDNYYSENWLEKLVDSYKLYPRAISAHKVTKFIWKNNSWQWEAGGREYYDSPSFLNKLVGVGGVLYPPNSLYKDIADRNLFMKLAPTNDDQWFWFMAILKETPVVVVENPIIHAKPVEGTLVNGLWKVNDTAEGNFEKQFKVLEENYPVATDRMKKEYIQRWEEKRYVSY